MLGAPLRFGVADCQHGGLVGCRHCLWLWVAAQQAYVASLQIRQRHTGACGGQAAARRAVAEAERALAELQAWRAAE